MKQTRQSGSSPGHAAVRGGLPWLAPLFLGAWLAALGPSAVLAQDDHATRLLENGDRLERDGKLTQARAAWTEVVSSYPDSTAAPSALDRLGTAAYPVEDFALRGQVAHEALVTARQVFERIAADYRASAEAPRAVFKLGLLFSDPSSPFFDLDEAYAKFSRITTVYPGSGFVDAGLYGMAEVLVRQGQPQRAVSAASRISRRPFEPFNLSATGTRTRATGPGPGIATRISCGCYGPATETRVISIPGFISCFRDSHQSGGSAR